MSRYPHRGGPLPIELANTLFVQDGLPRDALATPDDLADWLHTNLADVTESARSAAAARHLDRFRSLRSAVRELLSAVVERTEPPAAAVQLVNDLSAEAPHFVQLSWRDGSLHLIMVDAAEPATAPLAVVTRASIGLLTGADRERLAVCGAPGCVLFFLKDRRTHEWCSAACGNRARVARHYRRHHRADPPL